mgnify:CR=1 FL=1
MATGQSFKIVPKIMGNFVEVYYHVQQIGYVRKIAVLEMPNDAQMADNVDFVNELGALYRKRIKKSI